METASVKVDPEFPPRIIELGHGNVITGRANWNGRPALTFTPAPTAGAVGDSAAHFLQGATLTPKTTILTFKDADCVKRHMELLLGQLQEMAGEEA